MNFGGILFHDNVPLIFYIIYAFACIATLRRRSHVYANMVITCLCRNMVRTGFYP